MKNLSLLAPQEFVESYISTGEKKCEMPLLKMLLLALLSGIYIAVGGAAANTVSHALANPGLARLVSSAVFPVGIIMIVLTGAELFTGNCLITVSVLSKRAKLSGMLRNLFFVYMGNFAGALLIAAACVPTGQLGMGGGLLAVHTIELAAAKCALPLTSSFTTAVITNVLVCVAIMSAICAKDLTGRALGAYVPVFAFAVCGFEHSIANMFYIPAGIFAASVPEYAEMAVSAGIDISALGWGSFFLNNLLPVTLGNALGGIVFAATIWYCHGKKK